MSKKNDPFLDGLDSYNFVMKWKASGGQDALTAAAGAARLESGYAFARGDEQAARFWRDVVASFLEKLGQKQQEKYREFSAYADRDLAAYLLELEQQQAADADECIIVPGVKQREIP